MFSKATGKEGEHGATNPAGLVGAGAGGVHSVLPLWHSDRTVPMALGQDPSCFNSERCYEAPHPIRGSGCTQRAGG